MILNPSPQHLNQRQQCKHGLVLSGYQGGSVGTLAIYIERLINLLDRNPAISQKSALRCTVLSILMLLNFHPLEQLEITRTSNIQAALEFPF